MTKKQSKLGDLMPPKDLAAPVGPVPKAMDEGFDEHKDAALPPTKGRDLYPPGFEPRAQTVPPPSVNDPQADAERKRFGRELQEVERRVLKVQTPEDLVRVADQQFWEVAVRHVRFLVKRLIVQAATVEEAWAKFVQAKDATPNETELDHWRDWAHRNDARNCVPAGVEILLAQAVTVRRELLRVKGG